MNLELTPEAERVGIAYKTGYLEGLIAGVTMYAWWKDGTQYVGTCGTTLQEAVERITKEAKP